jgi:L-malate glycosyltransferase
VSDYGEGTRRRQPALSVLLGTRNRAQTLAAVLDCYGDLKAPRGGWKLIIVDNGSTDGTRQVIHSYESRLPVTYLFEPEPGKSRALNTGLASIAGDLVVLTDDDTLPRRDWLVRMRAAADAQPDYGIFGGTIVPRWQTAPEPWVLAWVPLGPVFTLTDPLLQEGPTTPHNVFGPNMAVRAHIFAHRGHRFDPRLGPLGRSYPMGSETDFVRRLVRQGVMVWHCREAIVEHLIPRAHMSMAWILGRAIRFGRGQYRLAGGQERAMSKTWGGVPRYILREMLVQQVHIVAAIAGFDKEKLFHARWRFNYLWGHAVEARAIARERADKMIMNAGV